MYCFVSKNASFVSFLIMYDSLTLHSTEKWKKGVKWKYCNELQVSNYESIGSSYEIGEVLNSDSHFGLDDILIDVPNMDESSADFTGTGLTRNRPDQPVLINLNFRFVILKE